MTDDPPRIMSVNWAAKVVEAQARADTLQAQLDETVVEREAWIKRAHGLQSRLGAEENELVIDWQGRAELAQGRLDAIREWREQMVGETPTKDDWRTLDSVLLIEEEK